MRQFLNILFFTVVTLASVQAEDLNLSGLPSTPQDKKDPPRSDLDFKAPSSQDFFRSGRKIFPQNFASPSASVRPFEVGKSSGPIASEDYPVGPGDQFLVNFWGRIEESIIVSINSDGKLLFPRVGLIDTRGLKYNQFNEVVSKAIEAKLKNVSYTISLYKAREFYIYVLGEVNSPGPVAVHASLRASEALALARGTRPTGTTQFIEVRRGDKVLTLDLIRFESKADFSANPFITEKDLIFVPPIGNFISLSGAILRPGSFEIREIKKLKEVIDRMGGLSIYADRSNRIRLSRMQRDGTRKQIQISMADERPSAKDSFFWEDFILQHGDEIFIPSSQLLIPSKSDSIFVTGEVKQPGSRPFRISATVDEYIGGSGGLTERANLGAALVYRSDGSSVRLTARMALEPGDTIYIPERTFKFWQDHLAVVTAFIGLATSIIVLSGR